jgi:hypothetical protein
MPRHLVSSNGVGRPGKLRAVRFLGRQLTQGVFSNRCVGSLDRRSIVGIVFCPSISPIYCSVGED